MNDNQYKPLTTQEEQGKYKYYFLREDNPGKYKRLSDRLIKSFEKLRLGEREHTPHSHNQRVGMLVVSDVLVCVYV